MSRRTYEFHAQTMQPRRFKRTSARFANLLLVLFCSFLSSSVMADLRLTGEAVQGGLIKGETTPGANIMLGGVAVPSTKDGHFLIGFHRDDTDSQILTIMLPDGSQSAHILSPEPRDWQVQRINGLAKKYVSPPEDVLARIALDREAVIRARSGTDTTTALFKNGFQWPLSGPVTGIYGSQRILNNQPRQPHFGVDIAAAKGTPVKTSAPGRVTMAKYLYYTGWTVIIDHGLGLTSTYSHLEGVAVSTDELVAREQVIGLVGSTGRSTGAHLDWRVNLGAKRLDPQIVARILNPDRH